MKATEQKHSLESLFRFKHLIRATFTLKIINVTLFWWKLLTNFHFLLTLPHCSHSFYLLFSPLVNYWTYWHYIIIGGFLFICGWMVMKCSYTVNRTVLQHRKQSRHHGCFQWLGSFIWFGCNVLFPLQGNLWWCCTNEKPLKGLTAFYSSAFSQQNDSSI